MLRNTTNPESFADANTGEQLNFLSENDFQLKGEQAQLNHLIAQLNDYLNELTALHDIPLIGANIGYIICIITLIIGCTASFYLSRELFYKSSTEPEPHYRYVFLNNGTPIPLDKGYRCVPGPYGHREHMFLIDSNGKQLAECDVVDENHSHKGAYLADGFALATLGVFGAIGGLTCLFDLLFRQWCDEPSVQPNVGLLSQQFNWLSLVAEKFKVLSEEQQPTTKENMEKLAVQLYHLKYDVFKKRNAINAVRELRDTVTDIRNDQNFSCRAFMLFSNQARPRETLIDVPPERKQALNLLP